MISGPTRAKASRARSRSGTCWRKLSTPNISYPPGSVRVLILFHITSVAPSSQGWLTPRACSVPAIMPVAMSEAAEWPSSGTHQGACGHPARVGSTKAAPPSAGAAAAVSQSQVPRTRSSSQASASSRTRKAISVAAGWLPGARQSGSSAWPKPPSSLR